MYLTQPVHRALACRPQAIATVCGERRRSFDEFGRRVARLAGALHSLGLQAGDRVGMLSLNSDRYLEYYMAVPWAGGVINPVNTRWSAPEIAYSLDDCDTRLLIVDDPFVPLVPELQQRSKSLRTVIHAGDGATPGGLLSYETLVADAQPVADALRSGSDLAGVFYTGGTTGHPKGVMLSHAGLAINALMMPAEGMVTEHTVGLHAAPMFHIAGCAFINGLWSVGARHVVMPSFTPLGALQAIAREQVTATVLVPTMIQMVVDHPELAQHDVASLQTVIYAGSPISEAVIDRATRMLPRTAFIQSYGMTELSPIASVLPARFHTREGRSHGKLLSGGRPSLCAELRVVDAHDRELPRGQVGEVVVRGPCVMLGYWNRADETREALRGGWMHTGDAGRLDDDGFVTIVDRIKDMIVSGGENVYSVEVENAIGKHPAVAACAVFGVPDARWGERVHAAVVLKPGSAATVEAIQAHCKELIAGYKCPRSIEFMAALPLSPAGKVLKTTLREAHWAGHPRRVA